MCTNIIFRYKLCSPLNNAYLQRISLKKYHGNSVLFSRTKSTYKFISKPNHLLSPTTTSSYKNLRHPIFHKIFATTIITFVSLKEYAKFKFIPFETPSMIPTIIPDSNILLLERRTIRSYGIDGGISCKTRQQEGFSKQKQYEQNNSKNMMLNVMSWHEFQLTSINDLDSNIISKFKRLYKRITTGIQVGDVIGIQHPNHLGITCTRVLGLPGDIVVQPKNHVIQNHRLIIGLFEDSDDYDSCIDALTNSKLITIPDGHVWVEGDNTTHSTDSREYGPVPIDWIEGKVICQVWPFERISLVESGGRPIPPKELPFEGSTILPAGYDGQRLQKAPK